MLFNRKLFFASVLHLLICINQCFAQTKVIPYQELPDPSGALTGSGMYFSASMNLADITVTFEGPADRWIALGFGSAMIPTDVFIYSCGHVMSVHPLGWQDYYNSSQNNSGVLVDAIQNWTVVSTNTISSGQRTVTATRNLSTGDLNDAVINFNVTSLNLVWARGASPDYTIAYHGGNNRANGISLPWLTLPTASFVTTTSVCAGSPLTFTNLSTGGLTTYTWNFPGGTPATSTATNPSVSYPTNGNYLVSLITSNSVGTDSYSQTCNVTITPTLATSVTIQQTAGNNPMCAGSPATFSATGLNGGISPSYQWKINGVNVGTSNPFISSLSGSGMVTCEFTSSQVCALPQPAISAALDMTVHSIDPALVSVALQSGTNPMCEGDILSFMATPSNGGSFPSYQWQVNGINVGTNSTTFTTNALVTNDIIHCVLNSNAPCASSTQAMSSGITITVNPIVVPTIIIGMNAADSLFCEGTPITFTTISTNGGSSPVYQWLVNGSASVINSDNFTPTLVTGTHSIHCILTSDLECAVPNSVSSDIVILHLLGCTGVSTHILEQGSLQVFPNPSTGQIMITSSDQEIKAVSVKDISGRKILNKIPVAQVRTISIDLSKEKPGIYLLEVLFENRTEIRRILLLN